MTEQNGIRYCDRCGVELTTSNNKCGYDICDKCNKYLEKQIKENEKMEMVANCTTCNDYNICACEDKGVSTVCDDYVPKLKKRGRPKKETDVTNYSNLPDAVRMSLESTSCELIKKINTLEEELTAKAKDLNKYKHDLQDIQEFLSSQQEG